MLRVKLIISICLFVLALPLLLLAETIYSKRLNDPDQREVDANEHLNENGDKRIDHYLV